MPSLLLARVCLVMVRNKADSHVMVTVPSRAPRNLVIVSLDNDTFQVSWERLREGEIEGG